MLRIIYTAEDTHKTDKGSNISRESVLTFKECSKNYTELIFTFLSCMFYKLKKKHSGLYNRWNLTK